MAIMITAEVTLCFNGKAALQKELENELGKEDRWNREISRNPSVLFVAGELLPPVGKEIIAPLAAAAKPEFNGV